MGALSFKLYDCVTDDNHLMPFHIFNLGLNLLGFL